AIDAAAAAIANPLLDDVAIKGARGVLINITGGLDLTLFEVDEAANHIRKEVDPEANIIIGSAFDESMEGRMRVSGVASGIDAETVRMAPPTMAPTAIGSNVRPLRPVETPRPAVSLRTSMATAVAPAPAPMPIREETIAPVAVAAPAPAA